MDKSSQSSAAESTAYPAPTTTSSSGSDCGGGTGGGGGNLNRDQYLRQLHKINHRISKPTVKNPAFHHVHQQQNQLPPPPPPPSIPPPPPPISQSSQPQGLQQQNQPPVYNISKNDFREVVQKLTGSPAHERISAPPPVQGPKAASSRLQRIRPPPLAQIGIARPPPMIQNPSSGGSGFWGNPVRPMGPPLSPLPPLPTCHAAAESPISAYMRFLHNSSSAVDSDLKRAPGIPFPPYAPPASPKFNDSTPPNPSFFPQSGMPPPQSPSFPFGFFPSPKSPCPLLSPGILFSPTGTGQFGFPQLPISPRVLPPVPSPK